MLILMFKMVVVMLVLTLLFVVAFACSRRQWR